MPRCVTPLNDEQLPLAPSVQAVHKANGNRIRALLNRAIEANGISYVDLSFETGIDEKQIGRALKEDGGAHPPLSLWAAVMVKDRLGLLVGGLCDLTGREAIVKKADPVAENKVLRGRLHEIRDELDRLLGGGA
jgi:hypothetical protein